MSSSSSSSSSYFRTLCRSTLLALLVSLALNYLAHNQHLDSPLELGNCDQLSELGRRQQITDYEQFYPFYLCEHSKPGTKLLHFVGTFNSFFLLFHHPFSPATFAVALAQGYGFAWLGHFGVEFNRPATFKYPGWSLVSDFVMFQDLFRGRCRMW